MKGIEGWARISIVLCLFGFLKSFKASEAFLTQYLISPQWVNITLTEAYQDVYPIWTYSYLAVLVFVFLLTGNLSIIITIMTTTNILRVNEYFVLISKIWLNTNL